jgi:integral membrane protein (TIGR00529 family)
MVFDLLKIGLTFLLILVLLRKKVRIGYVLLTGSALLALLYGMDVSEVARTVRNTAVNPVTIRLLLALSLIRVLEIILREKDVLSSMMSFVRDYFRNRKFVIVSMPMLIGMLPSLGGAYFSAPMVKEATEGLGMSREEKAFVNYWFRHPWEYILPLYPGILLAAAVSNIRLYHLIAANLAYALTLLATGFLYSMRGVGSKGPKGGADARADGRSEGPGRWTDFLPVLSVLILVVVFHMELYWALLSIIVVLILIYRYGPSEIFRLARKGFALEVIVMIAGVMLFKETMDSSGAVRNLSRVFIGEGIPVLPIVCLLPFLAGLLTGLTVGFVGSTFPLLISISGGAPLATMSLAFASGFIGVLLSPTHLCLILTKEYFKADLWGVYRKTIPASAFIFAAACLEYVILH